MPKTILTPLDRIARAKSNALELYTHTSKQTDLLVLLAEDLRRLEAIAPKDSKVKALADRTQRLRELINTMETGAFYISVEREMDLVYREL